MATPAVREPSADLASPAVDRPIVFDVTAHIAPEQETAFDRLTSEMNGSARAVGRAVSIDVTKSDGQDGAVERRISVAFASDDDLASWLASPEHAGFISRLKSMLVEPYATRVRTGMEGWVPTAGVKAPKRWKSAVATFCGLFPLLLVVQPVARELRFDVLGPPGALAASVAITCAAMTWLIMPLVTRALGEWLTK